MTDWLSFRLEDEFVAEYRDREVPWGFPCGGGLSLGELAFVTKYSRIKPDGSKERWHEVCERVVNGVYSIMQDHCAVRRTPWKADKAKRSAQEMYERMFTFKWLPPGRGLWMMGTEFVHAGKSSASVQNCAFVSTGAPFGFVFAAGRLMEMSMLGVGVGFDSRGADPECKVEAPTGGCREYRIEDSREGWCDSVTLLLASYLEPDHIKVVFDYSMIRGAGEPIRGFGGVAAGSEPLRQLHEQLRLILGDYAACDRSVDSILIGDVMNLIGRCVVAGNVRRSAEIWLGDSGDKAFLQSKDVSVFPARNAPDTGWGWASNNSVIAGVGGDYDHIIEGITRNGEPGLVYLDLCQSYGRLADPADDKDHRVLGINPCLAGDTLVAVADGRVSVTIRELAEAGIDVPVFTVFDDRAAVRTMRAPRLTGENVPILRVRLDDGTSLRVTPNHKFILRDGSTTEAQYLTAGTSLKSAQRLSVPGEYVRWNVGGNYWPGCPVEHRMVADWMVGRRLERHELVHHRNHHKDDNAPDNLELTTKSAHRALHAETDPEWDREYRRTLSDACAESLNGNAKPVTCDEVREAARALTRHVGHMLSWREWRTFGKTNGIPTQFTEWRTSELGPIADLLRWAARVEGLLPFTDDTADPRTLRMALDDLRAGYDVDVMDGRRVYCKMCEECDQAFTTPRRTVTYCTQRCGSTAGTRSNNRMANQRAAFDRKADLRLEQWLQVYTDMQFETGEVPTRKTWEASCRSQGIPVRFHGNSRAKTFAELRDLASSYNHRVVGIEPDGFDDVYNGTVDESHTLFVTGDDNGRWVLVGQCGEQPLESHELCTLVNTYPTRCDDLSDYIRTLKFAYLYGKAVTLMPTHWEETNEVMSRNHRIGTSMSGQAMFVETHGWARLRECMDEGYQEIRMWDRVYSEWLGVRESIKVTTVKPDGTTPLLCGTTSGVGWPVDGKAYIRRMRFGVDEPIVPALRKAGIHVEPDVTDPRRVVAELPVLGAGTRGEADVSLWEKAELAALAQRHWSDNAVSTTLSFREDEVPQVAAVIHAFDGRLKTMSFLPLRASGGSYAQMPQESRSVEEIERLQAAVHPVDIDALYAPGMSDAKGTKFCDGDSCELPG